MTMKRCYGCGRSIEVEIEDADIYYCSDCSEMMMQSPANGNAHVESGYKQETGEGLKPTNPKDMIGGDKIPFHLWPESATILGVLAMLDGALKYGRGNWRPGGVKFSIYYDALRRHMNKIIENEVIDPDSGLPHFGHALACLAILSDAWVNGNLDMDTNYGGRYAEFIDEMTPHVKRLKVKYADRHPHHYTGKDVQVKSE